MFPPKPLPSANPIHSMARNCCDTRHFALASVFGDQQNVEDELLFRSDIHAKNRRVWNAWAAGAIDPQTRARLIAEGRVVASDFSPLTDAEWAAIRRPVGAEGHKFVVTTREPDLPDPRVPSDFAYTHFDMPTSFRGFVFPAGLSLMGSIAQEGLDLRDATVLGDLNLAHFQVDVLLAGGLCVEGRTDARDLDTAIATEFVKASFRGAVDFRGARVHFASFAEAKFEAEADFAGCVLGGELDLRNACFKGQTRLRHLDVRRLAEAPLVDGLQLPKESKLQFAHLPLRSSDEPPYEMGPDQMCGLIAYFRNHGDHWSADLFETHLRRLEEEEGRTSQSPPG